MIVSFSSYQSDACLQVRDTGMVKLCQKLAALLVAVLCLMSLAGTAWAQNDPPLGSRLGERTEAGKAQSKQRAIQNAHKLAGCIYFKRDRTVQRWLLTTDISDYADASGIVFKDVECEFDEAIDPRVDNMAVYNTPASMRGTLAEAALRKEGKLAPRAEVLNVLPVEQAYDRPWYIMTERPRSVDEMATCFSETNPALVVALLRTKPASDEERSVIGNVASQLGPCLIGGTQLKANAFTLRASLAEAYFHRIYGPQPVADAVAKAAE